MRDVCLVSPYGTGMIFECWRTWSAGDRRPEVGSDGFGEPASGHVLEVFVVGGQRVVKPEMSNR